MLALYLPVKAQNYEVPKNYSLVNKEDYAPFEQDILKTISWLAQTPWTIDVDKRHEANAFLLKWLMGSPDVSVEVSSVEMLLTKKNPELLMTYMGTYAKYVIEHKGTPDMKTARITAIRAIIDKYNAEPTRVKDKAIEKLIKIDEQGKLDEWLSNPQKS